MNAYTSIAAYTVVVLTTGFLQGPQALRPALLEAADQPILTFASALAAAGQPAGFIVPASVLLEGRGKVPRRERATDDLDVVAKKFEASHPAYSATIRSGILHVRPRTLPGEWERLLATRFPDIRVAGVPAITAVVDIARRLAGTMDPAGGVAGTGPPPEDCPLAAPITYRGGAPTIIDLLDAVSTQSRGLGWLMTFIEKPDGGGSLSLGLICPNERMYSVQVDRIEWPQKRARTPTPFRIETKTWRGGVIIGTVLDLKNTAARRSGASSPR